jgi:transposase-like protein
MLGQKIEILRMYFNEGKGKKQISREIKVSKNTVKTYINEFLKNKKELIESGVSKFELIENMIDKPKYSTANRTSVVMTDEVKEIIDVFLKQNNERKSTGNIKLIMKATDMYEELIEKGFNLSYPSVAQYVQKYKSNANSLEAFVKQHYEFGEICEFDWGDAKLVVGTENINFKMAVFTLAKSGYRFAYLYRHENTEAFIDAHIRFFKHINGIPKTMVYDNMKVAVAKFVGRTEKEATIALKQLSVYYGFKFRFCNIASGNEKGHVERSVEFIRRKAFACLNVFESVELALEKLSQRLEKHNNMPTKYLDNQSPKELLIEEQKYLLPLIPDYINCITITDKADKLSTVSYLQNRYSVPDYLVQKEIHLRIFIDKIEMFVNNSLVTEHIRLNGNQEWSINIMHYTKTLLRKPGALIGSVAFKQMNEKLKQIYVKHFKNNSKEFISLLNLIGTSDFNNIKNIITTLENKNIDVTIDNIKMILNRNNDLVNMVPVTTSNMQNEIEEHSRQHLNIYDEIIGTKDLKGVEVA